ncbi:MAG: hypothetical protein AAFW70_11830 [Cyanobacteria bacterium J06635_10]
MTRISIISHGLRLYPNVAIAKWVEGRWGRGSRGGRWGDGEMGRWGRGGRGGRGGDGEMGRWGE